MKRDAEKKEYLLSTLEYVAESIERFGMPQTAMADPEDFAAQYKGAEKIVEDLREIGRLCEKGGKKVKAGLSEETIEALEIFIKEQFEKKLATPAMVEAIARLVEVIWR